MLWLSSSEFLERQPTWISQNKCLLKYTPCQVFWVCFGGPAGWVFCIWQADGISTCDGSFYASTWLGHGEPRYLVQHSQVCLRGHFRKQWPYASVDWRWVDGHHQDAEGLNRTKCKGKENFLSLLDCYSGTSVFSCPQTGLTPLGLLRPLYSDWTPPAGLAGVSSLWNPMSQFLCHSLHR